MSSSVNPNRQRLLSPLDYLAAMAGYTPPEPQQPIMGMPPPIDVPFRVHPLGPAPTAPMNPYVPAIPMEVVESRRRMGWG